MSGSLLMLVEQVSQGNGWCRIKISAPEEEYRQIKVANVKGTVITDLLCWLNRWLGAIQRGLENEDDLWIVVTC